MKPLPTSFLVAGALGISALGSTIGGASSPVAADPTGQIVAGVQLGPVRLQMRADEGARVAFAFEHRTGCHIDLLIIAGRVNAAGTRFGGCLEVLVPDDNTRISGPTDFALPWTGPFVGGPASAFILAFGDYLQVNLSTHHVALIWPQGLVAHVADAPVASDVVTYLAVVASGSKQIPAIGYFRAPVR